MISSVYDPERVEDRNRFVDREDECREDDELYDLGTYDCLTPCRLASWMYNFYHLGIHNENPLPPVHDSRFHRILEAADGATSVLERRAPAHRLLEVEWGVSLDKPWPDVTLPWMSEYYEGLPKTPVQELYLIVKGFIVEKARAWHVGLGMGLGTSELRDCLWVAREAGIRAIIGLLGQPGMDELLEFEEVQTHAEKEMS